MKKIILVTHGKAEKDLPDPRLTSKGREQMKELRTQLFKEFIEFEFVIAGGGRRHKEAAQIILGNRRPDLGSEIVGVPDVLSSNEEYMILADGEKIPVKKYEKTRYKKIKQRVVPFLKQLFNRPEKNILIVGGRITAIGAGVPAKKAKSAHVYQIELIPSGKLKISK